MKKYKIYPKRRETTKQKPQIEKKVNFWKFPQNFGKIYKILIYNRIWKYNGIKLIRFFL